MNVYGELQIAGNNCVQNESPTLHAASLSSSLMTWGLRTRVLDGLEHQMQAFQAEHEATLAKVGKEFVLPPDDSVLSFLNDHRTIAQILLEAASHLRAAFPAATVFHLRSRLDDAGARTLYAVAIWPGNVTDARKALASFDGSWWMGHLRRAGGYLEFTYELA